jgi:hypothetical protein
MRALKLDAKPDDGHVHELAADRGVAICVRCGLPVPKDLAPRAVAPRPSPPRPPPSRLAAVDPRLAPSTRPAYGGAVVDASAMFRSRQENPT